MSVRGTVAVVGLLAACGVEPATAPPVAAPGLVATGSWAEAERAVLASLRLTSELPADPTNRWADDPAAAVLGRRLFYDANLSPSGRFSCASCHDPQRHFTDGLPKAVGAGLTRRNTPPIEGSQLGPWFFWDGRADSLWAQAAGPVEAPEEMDSDRLHVAHRVLSSHRAAYEVVFGPSPDLSDITRFPRRGRPAPEDPLGPLAAAWDGMASEDRARVNGVFVNSLKAIAAFERTVLAAEAPFDRYVDAVLAGDPGGGGHLDDAQVRGLRVFLGAGCTDCHHGPYFTDRAFHPLGLPEDVYDPGRVVGAARALKSPLNCAGPHSDAKRCDELRFLNPEFEDFRGAFKTPTLRNVSATAPYMHHGELRSLEDVVAFYDSLPGVPAIGHRELTLKPLGLSSDESAELVAFLRSLEAPVRPEALPPALD